MEIYKLTAHLNNGTPSSFVFAYLPENFEGIKIAQKFSFVNPMGYTPKFSIDTMRIVASDKVAIDSTFLQYGLESDVTIDIQELNTNGTTYGTARTFAIDFESYEIFDDFSEFALKSVSVIDTYNKIKNTEVQIELVNTTTFVPLGNAVINYVSLSKSKITQGSVAPGAHHAYFVMGKNNESKIFDKSTSLFTQLSTPYGNLDDVDIYNFGEAQTTPKIKMSTSGAVEILTFTTGFPATQPTKLCLYKNNLSTPVHTFFSQILTANTAYNVDLSFNDFLADASYSANDVLFIAATSPEHYFFITGEVSIDFRIQSAKNIVNEDSSTINIAYIANVLDYIFDSAVQYPYAEDITYNAITSATSLMKLDNFLNIKPKDFLSDLCLLGGLMLNFKLDSTVELYNISNYFNNLFEVDIDLNPINFLAITDYKDLSIRHELELNFASVAVGQERENYEAYTYFEDWNKILTFSQAARNASESLDLTNTKLRSDFSGILEYIFKRSQQNPTPTKEAFILDPYFTVRTGTDASITMYDFFTPRDILTNWSKFLSFCFQNYGKDTLAISSNGGTADNITIDSVAQMDDFVLSESPRLLPLAYTFTALIDDVDFSEKILKLNHNDEDIYIFVTNAETTDQLREQTITGLKIQF